MTPGLSLLMTLEVLVGAPVSVDASPHGRRFIPILGGRVGDGLDADPLAARPERLAAAIKGARLRLAPGDHRSVVAAPQFAAALAEFLA